MWSMYVCKYCQIILYVSFNNCYSSNALWNLMTLELHHIYNIWGFRVISSWTLTLTWREWCKRLEHKESKDGNEQSEGFIYVWVIVCLSDIVVNKPTTNRRSNRRSASRPNRPSQMKIKRPIDRQKKKCRSIRRRLWSGFVLRAPISENYNRNSLTSLVSNLCLICK